MKKGLFLLSLIVTFYALGTVSALSLIHISPDAVTQTLHRARKKLAEILDERGETP